jgi:excisionase family DNA binding protein
MFEKV